MDPLIAGVRLVHALYVAFVVMAPALLWSGLLQGSRGLTVPALGRVHLACLAFATLQLACGWPCPLTSLEARLADRAPAAFIVPDAWTGAAAIPPWAWLALALAWALSLWTTRATIRHRAQLEPA